jgi:hypothetical protein
MPEDLNIPQIDPDPIPKITPEVKTNAMKLKMQQFKERLQNFVKKLRIKNRTTITLSKRSKIIFGITALILFIFVVFPLARLAVNARVLVANMNAVNAAVDTQDLQKMKVEVTSFQSNLDTFRGNLSALSYIKYIPLLGVYYSDADSAVAAGQYAMDAAQIVVTTLEPYADIIGLKGGQSSGGQTANDRVEFIIKTIDQISPKLDEISEKAELAGSELKKINPKRYPKEIRGKKIRENIIEIQTIADTAVSFIADGKPLIQKANYFMGIDAPRKYLVLFQNDKELRPTGGFLTAYTIMTVNKGKIEPSDSSDIYSLDANYKPSVEAPEEFRRYIQGPYALQPNFYLRDMNWNPDFRQSIEVFLEQAKSVDLAEVDGVIAVDTEVLVKLLKVTGPVEVAGYGRYSADTDPECNCPQVVHALEEYADVEGPVVWSENEPGKIVFAPPNYGKNRKEIVGPLMNTVLSMTLGLPMERMPFLFQASWESFTEKHLLFYMHEESAQEAVESFNIAGRIKDTDVDYLHINNANLGGRKSNLYARHEVNQEVTVAKDGTVEKTVTITYKNPQGYDGWLNSVLPNWVRVYVPKGSELISFEGTDDKKDPYEELSKTVFAGGFKLRPQGVQKIVVKYKLPFKVQGEEYKMLIQKQPGTGDTLYSFEVNGELQEVQLKTDQEFKFGL